MSGQVPHDERMAAAAMLLGAIRGMVQLQEDRLREFLDYRSIDHVTDDEGVVVGLQIDLGSGPFILTITPVTP